MSNLSSIARPYALAAFECAREKEALPAWKAMLASAALVAKNPSVASLLRNPQTGSKQLYELFEGVLKSLLDDERKNFLRLLAQNKRLAAMPEISEAFDVYCAQLEKMSNVRMITAIELKNDFRDKFVKSISKRIKRDVTLHCEVDPTILGGAIIHIGDSVIDGSLRGTLNRLLESSLR